MASRLKWSLGFGGGAIFLFLAGAYAALRMEGSNRTVAALLTAAVFAHMAYRFYRWNGPGWRKYHERAMLAWSGFWGRELSRASQATAEPSIANAARELWAFLLEAENQTRGRASMQRLVAGDAAGALQLMVNDIKRVGPRVCAEPTLDDLEINGGCRMAEVLSANIEVANGRLSQEAIDGALRELPKLKFGAQIVIFGIVSRFMGEREGARYVVAAIRGLAR